jgi:hypothetical protein
LTDNSKSPDEFDGYGSQQQQRLYPGRGKGHSDDFSINICKTRISYRISGKNAET